MEPFSSKHHQDEATGYGEAREEALARGDLDSAEMFADFEVDETIRAERAAAREAEELAGIEADRLQAMHDEQISAEHGA